VTVACPAEPGLGAVPPEGRPRPAPDPAAPEHWNWFDRPEPLNPGATLLVLLVTAAVLLGCGHMIWRAATSEDAAGVPVELTEFRSTTGMALTAAPVRVRIPAIGVSSLLERLGKNEDDTVQVPRNPDRAGWFTGGPRPGEPGSAVLLGHYDSTCCPAVFYRLAKLRPGDQIQVQRADGSTVVFRVSRVGQYRTSRFPVREVYFPTLRPQLRLITCAGPYQRRQHAYRDNTVIFADQVAVRAGVERAAASG
jgi:sortase (surface protein transpeptidase)